MVSGGGDGATKVRVPGRRSDSPVVIGWRWDSEGVPRKRGRPSSEVSGVPVKEGGRISEKSGKPYGKNNG